MSQSDVANLLFWVPTALLVYIVAALVRPFGPLKSRRHAFIAFLVFAGLLAFRMSSRAFDKSPDGLHYESRRFYGTPLPPTPTPPVHPEPQPKLDPYNPKVERPFRE